MNHYRSFLVGLLLSAVAWPAAAAEPITVVALGDSITRGVRPGVKADETFAAVLGERLKEKGVAARVLNAGVGGETTEGALARLDQDVLAHKPKVVLVMYGTNDSYVDQGKTGSRLSPEQYRANLGRLLERIEAAGAEPLLMTEPRYAPGHKNGAGEDPNVRLERFMEACREVGRARKARVIDHYRRWTRAELKGTKLNDWTTDGYHPNPEGHREMAAAILPVLLAVLPPPPEEPSANLGGVTEKHEMVPMRDGTRLSVYLYFPPGAGPWPVLYEQRYADLRGAATRKSYAKLAEAGYVVAAQNFRGTHKSEGTWVGYRALGWGELQDGFDTVAWLAKQRWSTGKVGTFGSSQAGYAQNFLAVTRPPALKAQYMIDTGLSLFHEGYRIGGTTRPERFKQLDAVCRDPADNRRLLKEWFAHPTYDDYWAAEDCTRHFDRMDVPCFTVGSWYDFMCDGSVESFIGRQHRGGPNSQKRQQLLLGPWLHGRVKNGAKVGDLTYPEDARFDVDEHMVRWFDHYLKDSDNCVPADPVVRYYVMGAVGEKGAPGNEWETADDWPVPARPTAYFLRDGGRLMTAAPDEENAATRFAADPRNPARVPGRAFPGAQDARPFEKQAEVRTFTTERLVAPVEWTGQVQAELWVTSTARDTDFIVRVSDVYPDGRSILLMDYVRRARYRDGYEREVLLEPGKVTRVAFDVGWLSQVFNAGHRIRVTVASTAAPFYEPNPNTGEPLTLDPPATTVVARNAVRHDRRHASRVIAPVRPR